MIADWEKLGEGLVRINVFGLCLMAGLVLTMLVWQCAAGQKSPHEGPWSGGSTLEELHGRLCTDELATTTQELLADELARYLPPSEVHGLAWLPVINVSPPLLRSVGLWSRRDPDTGLFDPPLPDSFTKEQKQFMLGMAVARSCWTGGPLAVQFVDDRNHRFVAYVTNSYEVHRE